MQLAELKKAQWAITDRLTQAAQQLETQASGLDSSFRAGAGDSVPQLLARAQAAICLPISIRTRSRS